MMRALDARVTIVFAGLFSGLTALMQDWRALSASLGVAIALAAVSGVSWRQLGHRLLYVAWGLAAIWILVPIDFDPASAWGWSWRWESAALPARVSFRAVAIVLGVTALLEPMGLLGLLHGLRSLHVPDRLLTLVSMSVRYSFMLRDEYKRLYGAMVSRGYRLSATRAGYTGLSSALGMLLVRSLDRSERVSRAMASRDAGLRTRASREPWNVRDLLASLLGMLLLAGLAALEWIGGSSSSLD
jgi:cobalt/nickel transport system permease protein